MVSRIPARGIKMRMTEKYRIDAGCPMIMKGCSTGCPLIQVSVSRSATGSQNRTEGLEGYSLLFGVWRSGMIARVRMDKTRAATPPNLFGVHNSFSVFLYLTFGFSYSRSFSPSPFNTGMSLGLDFACLLLTLYLVMLVSFLYMLTNPNLYL